MNAKMKMFMYIDHHELCNLSMFNCYFKREVIAI